MGLLGDIGNFFSGAANDVKAGAEDLAHGAEDVGGTLLHETQVFGQGALYGLVQQPIDGVEQLVDHVSKPLFGTELPNLHIIDAPKVKPGSFDSWVAGAGELTGMAGTFFLGGQAVEAIGLAGKVGELGGLADRLPLSARFIAPAEAAIPKAIGGAAFGFFLRPTNNKEGGDFWKSRILNAIGFGVGNGATPFIKDAFGSFFGSKLETRIASFAQKELKLMHVSDQVAGGIAGGVGTVAQDAAKLGPLATGDATSARGTATAYTSTRLGAFLSTADRTLSHLSGKPRTYAVRLGG